MCARSRRAVAPAGDRTGEVTSSPAALQDPHRGNWHIDRHRSAGLLRGLPPTSCLWLRCRHGATRQRSPELRLPETPRPRQNCGGLFSTACIRLECYWLHDELNVCPRGLGFGNGQSRERHLFSGHVHACLCHACCSHDRCGHDIGPGPCGAHGDHAGSGRACHRDGAGPTRCRRFLRRRTASRFSRSGDVRVRLYRPFNLSSIAWR